MSDIVCLFITRYLRTHALETINIQGLDMDEMDIHWVLTVPAIWSDGAKQFMREAAQSVTSSSSSRAYCSRQQ